MQELLKNKYFNDSSIQDLALRLKSAYPAFQDALFVSGIMDESWDALELKARMRKITLNLGKYLPDDYEQALDILDKVVADFPAGFYNFTFICLPDFVEVFGQDECSLELSIAALERYTSSSTSEFAVRSFIIKYEARMMQQMAVWSRNDNEHIRRLASEGCRPSLPWGQALPGFKKDPSLVIGILEQLKTDPSLYVRKSVANNLNDISKAQPELVAAIARAWYGKDKYTDWIVKHGCRTLLKRGNREVLEIFGFADASHVYIDGFTLNTDAVSIGEVLTFSFLISGEKTTKVRLEYGIDYVKSGGRRHRKIFQISEFFLKENQQQTFTKAHSFADLSSRRHYPGIHSITLIVNGAERGSLDFEVLAAQS